MAPKGKVITENANTENPSTYYLEEGKYVTGYYATLVYVMSGLAKVVYVSETFQKKKYEILSKNCELASVPLFEIETPKDELRDIEVFAIVDTSQRESRSS